MLLVVGITVYAVLHPKPTAPGLACRTVVVAAGLGLCVFCRSSASLLFPGLILAAGIGAWRVWPDGRRRATALVVATALFLSPIPLVGQAQQNDSWQPVWEGLGDFDRTKGFTWSDATAEEAARGSGAPGLFTPASEAFFKSEVLGAITSDPAWYASILARRFASTLSLWKLWPMQALSDTPIRRSASPNEGVMDKYWTYATTFDHIGFGSIRYEVPLPLFWFPALALMGACFAAGPARARARAAMKTLAPVVASCLTLPVLITSAGGSEAQAIGVAYLLAAALTTDLLLRSLVGRVPTRASGA